MDQPKTAITSDQISRPENKRDSSGDQTVKVRALKVFHKGEDTSGEMTKAGDEFDLPRWRAAQLRANGLIEYPNESDAHDIHGKDEAQRIDDKVKRQADAGKIPANSKGTPLRNPELKMAPEPKG